MDYRGGVKPRGPINVRCSIFYEILPIRDWAFGHLNNGHWFISRTQAWAISAKDWDVAFFQWIIAWYVRKKIGVGKCWGSLHSWNASFDGGGTMWRRNRINPNTTKGRILWINGYFRWHFITVGVELVVHFPQQMRCYEKKSKESVWVDVRYRISVGVVSGSAALASPPLPPDSRALRSNLKSASDIFATRARGSCGVDPGPVRLRIATLPVWFMGDWLYGVRKRLVFVQFLMFSTFAMQRFTVWTVWGGATDLALIRPRKGSLGAAVFEGMAPSSA